MAIDFKMLGSGSTGNCGLLKTAQSTILIDAGFSCKQTKRMLLKQGIAPEQVDAVFITHEHFDHIQGLRGLRKYENIRFFANENTMSAIERKYTFDIQWLTFHTGDKMTFNDLSVCSFTLPHDAADPIGYVFSTQDGVDGHIKSMAWMTDLGYIPSHVIKYVSDVDLLVIESNYDNELLENDTKRPDYVKDRIRSRYGHLSNKMAINFVMGNRSNKWKKVIFAHVSADCNDEVIIKEMLKNEDCPFEFEIASAQAQDA